MRDQFRSVNQSVDNRKVDYLSENEVAETKPTEELLVGPVSIESVVGCDERVSIDCLSKAERSKRCDHL